MSTVKNTFCKNAAFFLLALGLLVGCTKGGSSPSNQKVVNLAIWGSYLSPEMTEKFQKDSGIKLNISNYASNEELLAKVQAGASGIDVAVPSDYMVSIMIKLDLLEPLDRAKITNFSHLNSDLLKQPFDVENKFSVPYSWSTAGIAVNRDLFKGSIKSWKDLFNNPAVAGKVSMLDDVREVTAAALKSHGFSVNSTNPAELKQAEDTLMKMKSKVKMFSSDTADALVKKEIAIAQSYSTDALQAAAQNKAIEYILPEEGGTRSIDTIVILKGSQHKEAAHALVNFMLSPEVNVKFVKTIWGGPVLKETRDQLPAEMKANTALFPAAVQIGKFEPLIDLGEQTRMYDELWTKIKTE